MRVMRVLVLAALMSIPLAAAADPCADFKWDVSHEVALFAGAATALPAEKLAAPIRPDRLYELQLLPDSKITFVHEPGKKSALGDFAGLAALKLDSPGNYIVSADQPVWIDVVGNGQLIPTRNYQGSRECHAPHKIVEFDLTGGTEFVLQLSGSGTAAVRITVTKTPALRAPTTP